MQSDGDLARPALADLMPAVATCLGHPMPGRAELDLGIPSSNKVVVVLLDGLGAQLLSRRGGHAPFLAGLTSRPLTAGFPSTTATSMGSLGTGLAPGEHGLVGLELRDPDQDLLFSTLAWDARVDPHRWQPEQTVFEHLADREVEVARIGPAYFDGSGLTEAALRGGRFIAGTSLEQRVDAALAALRSARDRSALVYLYWGEIDKVGHVHGCESWQWADELSATDAALARLRRLAPSGTTILITADHGMVDVAMHDRLDLAHERDLARGVAAVGGEPRALHLYCDPGAAADVAQVWRERLGDQMQVLLRQEAIAAGWFGPVQPRVVERIGDVVTSAVSDIAVVDSRTARPQVLALIGLHGARTAQESLIPLLSTSA